MYFPTAGIEVSPLVPPAAAFLVSFFTSMGGISGAFLLLPFQMSFLGYVNTSVSATNQLYNVFSNPGGIFRYYREHRLLWPLVWLLMAGAVPGAMIGALIRVNWLPEARPFKLFVAVVVLSIGLELLRDLFSKPISQPVSRETTSDVLAGIFVREKTASHITYAYAGFLYTFSVKKLLAFSVGVGLIGGIYGIGGGAIISPFLVAVFHLPIHTIAGATLTATCLTALISVLFYVLLAPFYPHLTVAPDWGLAFLLGLGGIAGMYLGARCQKYVPARMLKWMLVCILLATALAYGIEFFRR